MVLVALRRFPSAQTRLHLDEVLSPIALQGFRPAFSAVFFGERASEISDQALPNAPMTASRPLTITTFPATPEPKPLPDCSAALP